MEEGQQQQQQQQLRDRRPEALGGLRVLPDELLCVILGGLSPRDLGRLACVSSVMYILCNEETLWMNLCLRVDGPLEYKNSWKKTTLYRQNLSTEVSESNEKTLRFEGFNSLFLYRRWYRCFTTLENFIMDKGDMERKEDMSLGEFSTNYDGQKPVLLTDLANTWPSRNTWTIDQLVQKYGETAFRISQRSSKKITMKFKDYVSYMSHQHDEDPLYIFDDKFAEAAPSLLNDYTVPVLFREDFFDVLDVEQRPPFRWLIIGPERSGASWHVDPALTSAWNTLLLGRKRWALYPPGRVPGGVTVHVNEEDGDVDVESPSSLQWWLDIYPFLADEDKPLECTQLPGETIFVPSGWWHCVLNLETTIAVTQNFVNTCNLQFVCLDMSPGHLHKGVSRAGWLAVQDKIIKLVKADSDVEQLDYVDTMRKEKRLKLLKPAEEQSRYKRSENENKSNIYTDFRDGNFSYDIEFLSKFLKEERDHYNSAWSAGNCIGQREFRQWLHKLWALKPEIRPLVWKGACLALNVDQWLACVMEICGSHDLPSPRDNEKLPVGTGSNPVFLVSDYVIKIYIEGGLESSLYSLGTELEFYSLLHKLKSPLVKHVPVIFASGIVVHEGGFYRSCTWNGKGVPDLLTNFDLVDGNFLDDGFLFGVWGKMKFELRKEAAVSHSRIWPYLITKRCEGDIFANLRDRLSSDAILNLASFLGEQLRNLHLLPLPSRQIASPLESSEIHFTRRVSNGLDNHSDVFQRHFVKNEVTVSIRFSSEWKPFVAAIERRKIDLSSRLLQWGDPVPGVLVDKVEKYIPQDPALLLNVFKGEDGLYEAGHLPSWVHSDIMDDNIYMEQCCASRCFSPTITYAGSISVDTRTNDNMEESPKKWCPTHILDFGDLFIGDPICDLIPIHLDVFRGDSTLLKQFLESYNLPLGKKSSDDTLRGGAKFERTSYRAMCYCILHEENVLGAIFSLWKDLRGATSWEEVEEAVWGELNNYQCAD